MATSILNVLQYCGVRALTAVAQALPYRAAVGLACCMADLVYRFDRRHRQVGLDNLKLAYGEDLDERRSMTIVRGVYRHLFLSGIELLFLARRLRDGNWSRYIELANQEGLDEALSHERGVVFVSGHFGNWEVMGVALSRAWLPIASVARPLKNPLIDRYVCRIREGSGQKIIPKKGAMRKLARLVRHGQGVAFLVDQNVRRPDIFVDFFGVPAATTSAFAALAYKFDCPVVSVFCRRTGDFRFLVEIGAPIYPDRSRPKAEEVRRITVECTERLEREVRKAPDQWMWVHRRWKTRPVVGSSPPIEEAALAQ